MNWHFANLNTFYNDFDINIFDINKVTQSTSTLINNQIIHADKIAISAKNLNRLCANTQIFSN